MSAIAERIDVTAPGVNIVPTKRESEKTRFLPPFSNILVFLEKTKTPQRPPSRIRFGALRNRGLRIIAPIPVELERKGSTVVARWDEIEEFGYGRNISEAIEDFSRTVEELFLSLNERKGDLGPDLQSVREVLCRYIASRPPQG